MREIAARPARAAASMRRVILALVLAAAACARGGGAEPGVRIDCTIDPSPAAMGPATIDVALADASGRPIEGADVHVEGNMNHAGMVPEMASANEVSPGVYRAAIEFTMGGDWYLLVEARLPDGRRVDRTIDVPNVRSD